MPIDLQETLHIAVIVYFVYFKSRALITQYYIHYTYKVVFCFHIVLPKHAFHYRTHTGMY